jgi:2-polyprenyl-6-methoxyphenol hydroxylase-like FAD-dependent oxidoreductase
MPMRDAIDVLICGAGAAGLTLAIDLARHGVRFRIVEKLDAPFAGSRGKGIQPRTLEVFEDLGIVDRIAALGGRYAPFRTYRNDGSYVDSPIEDSYAATTAEPYRMPLMLPQFLTERVMRERLAELGARVEFGCEMVEFDQDDDGVHARVMNRSREERILARYLVGADGGQSFVRKALGIDFAGKSLDVRAVVADLALAGLDRSVWHRFNEGSMESMILVCPLAGTELFQLQAPVPLQGAVDLSAQGLTQMLSERTGRSDIRVESVAWASAYHMNARLADRYRIDRVFLIGDAAHVHPPTGGQGLNTSVQDAYNLGWKLAAVIAGGPHALLDTYEEERRPIAADMLGLTTALLNAAKRGEMRRGREVQQLDLGYAHSSLVLESSVRTCGVLAGDRAPDALVRGAAGQRRRMFELFAGPHWTLLGYDVERDRVRPRPGLRIHSFGSRGDLVDEGNCFRDTYGMSSGDWVLIRPDGYVGAIVTTRRIDALLDYLQRVGLRELH